MTVPTTASVGSILQVEDADPWDYMERLRSVGDIVWDEEMQSWLVSSYELMREIGRCDDDAFLSTFVPSEHNAFLDLTPEEWTWFQGGSVRGSLTLSQGEEHHRLHRWWMRIYPPRVLQQWRETRFVPIMHAQIDRFAARGTADLVEEYAYRVTPRVIASMLGFPADDDEWIERLEGLFTARLAFRQRQSLAEPPTPEDKRRAFDATRELQELLEPIVRSRQSGEGDDLISLVWRQAPEAWGPDYSADDVYSMIRAWWSSGTLTVAHGCANALYVALTNPQLRERALTGDDKAIRGIMEEGLRLYGVAFWVGRRATRDVELGGVRIRAGDQVLGLAVSASRDAARYPDPHEVDIERTSPKDHFAFMGGPRTCPGQALARTEIEDLLAVLLQRLPDVELDPDAEPPRYRGFVARAWKPLNVRFTQTV